MPNSFLLYGFFTTTIFLPIVASQTCYLPNGDIYSSTPCNLTAPQSACCGTSDSCLTNGYCYTSSMVAYRGGCTDPTFNSSACPQYCSDVYTNGGPYLYFVAWGSGASTYCCFDGYNDTGEELCRTPTHGSLQPFKVPYGEVIFDRTNGSTAPKGAVTTTIYTMSTTATLSSTATTDCDTSAQQHRSGPTSHDNLAVGLGVGLPLGVLLLASLSLLWLQHRKLRQFDQVTLKNTAPQPSEAEHEVFQWRMREADGKPVSELPAQR